MSLQAVVSLVVGSAVVLSVPALVWSKSFSNLYRGASARISDSFRAVAARVALAMSANSVE
jgi:hypothetical protein